MYTNPTFLQASTISCATFFRPDSSSACFHSEKSTKGIFIAVEVLAEDMVRDTGVKF